MYVYEEMVNGRKLTEIINTDHENVKYLPGHKLPVNVVARPDVVETAKDADIIIFVLPHQFMTNTCKPLIGNIKPDSFGVSLCKVIFFNSSIIVRNLINLYKIRDSMLTQKVK